MTFLGYKLSEEDCRPGEVIVARDDHLQTLNQDKQKGELAIRNGDPRGSLRARAVYAFADRKVAEDLLSQTDGEHLYEVAIDDGDIIHRGDLRIYDEIVRALKEGRAVDHLVAAYWEGQRRSSPRVELCVTKMMVGRKLD